MCPEFVAIILLLPSQPHHFHWFHAPSSRCVETKFIYVLIFLNGVVNLVQSWIGSTITALSLSQGSKTYIFLSWIGTGFHQSVEPPCPNSCWVPPMGVFLALLTRVREVVSRHWTVIKYFFDWLKIMAPSQRIYIFVFHYTLLKFFYTSLGSYSISVLQIRYLTSYAKIIIAFLSEKMASNSFFFATLCLVWWSVISTFQQMRRPELGKNNIWPGTLNSLSDWSDCATSRKCLKTGRHFGSLGDVSDSGVDVVRALTVLDEWRSEYLGQVEQLVRTDTVDSRLKVSFVGGSNYSAFQIFLPLAFASWTIQTRR